MTRPDEWALVRGATEEQRARAEQAEAALAAERGRREAVEAKLAYIAPALPVLKTMCEVAGLNAGAAKAAEMIASLGAQAAEGNA